MASLSELMDEYNVELDDIRWYLSQDIADELINYKDRHVELAMEIWSGRLGDRLYELEDRFVRELGDALAHGRTDEVKVRTVLSEVRAARRRRPRGLKAG